MGNKLTKLKLMGYLDMIESHLKEKTITEEDLKNYKDGLEQALICLPEARLWHDTIFCTNKIRTLQNRVNKKLVYA